MTKIAIAVLGTRGYPSFYGGFETAVRHIVEDAKSTNFIYYVFSRRQNCDPNPEKLNAQVIYTPNLNSKRFSTLSHIFFSIPKLMSLRPDVVLAFNVSCGYILPFTKLMGIPVILNVDGLEWKRAKWGRFGKLAFLLGAKLCARYAEVLVADSTNIAQYWKVRFGRDSIFIPYGGTPSAIDNWEHSQKRDYLLYVARFVPENHFEEFLASLEYLDPSIPVIIGGTSNGNPLYDELLQSAVASRANVQTIGSVKDDAYLSRLWAEAGIYFHGHSVGGTNPALVQAMASGSPIVAYDSVYNREVLADAGIYSTAVPSEMGLLFNELMLDLESRKKLSLNAIRRANDFYTWSAVIDAYENAIKAILAN